MCFCGILFKKNGSRSTAQQYGVKCSLVNLQMNTITHGNFAVLLDMYRVSFGMHLASSIRALRVDKNQK